MDVWRIAGEEGSAIPDLIDRAARLGCTVVPRYLSATAGADSPNGANTTDPILFWQEADDPHARASALLAGADEIIGPWMDRNEALARLLRLSKRTGQGGQRLVLGDLDIDLVDHSARRADRPLNLLAREYLLLLHFARHTGRVQSKEALLRSIWRLGFDPGTNVVQVHVSRLRAKLDRDFARPMLHTIRGVGYCLVPDG